MYLYILFLRQIAMNLQVALMQFAYFALICMFRLSFDNNAARLISTKLIDLDLLKISCNDEYALKETI